MLASFVVLIGITTTEFISECYEEFCCPEDTDIIIFKHMFNANDIKFICASDYNHQIGYSIQRGHSLELSAKSHVIGQREIDGGKSDVFIHQFRPPRSVGEFHFIPGGSSQEIRRLVVREEPLLGPVSFESPTLKVCGNIADEELSLISDKYRVRLATSGFNQVYEFDTPKRRKRRRRDAVNDCSLNFELTLSKSDAKILEEKTKVQVTSIFTKLDGSEIEREIGTVEPRKAIIHVCKAKTRPR